MKFESLIVGIFIVAIIVTGMYNFAGGLAAESALNITINDTYKTTFDQTSDLTDEIQNAQGKIENLSTQKEGAAIITLVPDVLSILKSMVFLPITAMNAIVNGVAEVFGIPGWIISFMLSIVTLIAIMVFARIVLGRAN